MKKTLLTAMFALAAAMCAAQDPIPVPVDPPTIKFHSVSSSGHNLYYKVTSNDNPRTVMLIRENPDSSNQFPGDVVIPDTVTHDGKTYKVTGIGDYAFSYCYNMTSVTFPKYLETIGKKIFYMGGYSRTIYYNSVRLSLPQPYIWNDGQLFFHLNVVIGDEVDTVPSNVFTNATVTSLTVGSSVKHIEDYAFYWCDDNIEIVMKPAVPPTLMEHSFWVGCKWNAKVHVPCELYDEYVAAYGGYFNNLYEKVAYRYDVRCEPRWTGQVKTKISYCDIPELRMEAEQGHGYAFSHWWDGSTENPRNIVLTQDTVIVAYFNYTSVDETCEALLSVSPNPTDGMFTIEAEDIKTVEVFNQMGQRVLADRSGSRTINADGLPAGIYFLKVETATATKYGKLMKK